MLDQLTVLLVGLFHKLMQCGLGGPPAQFLFERDGAEYWLLPRQHWFARASSGAAAMAFGGQVYFFHKWAVREDVIAHEATHVAQFRRGPFKAMVETSRSKALPYMQRPNEIEAYAVQKAVVTAFNNAYLTARQRRQVLPTLKVAVKVERTKGQERRRLKRRLRRKGR